jgi:NAD(P)H-dependent FMN reductase
VGNFLALTGIAKHQSFSRALASAMKEAAPSLQLFAADFFPLPIPDIMRSDHAPFLLRGLPAVMLTDTANFRNPNYHKPTDVVATLDMDRLKVAAEALAGATETLAERSKK